MKKTLLIIPAYQPKENFINFIIKCQQFFHKIIVVNDGSADNFNNIFKNIANDNVMIINHSINLGKGRALKTAFNYVINHNLDYEVIVTADCDGQHLVEDIINCVDNVSAKELIIGVRKFDNVSMPTLNRLGNSITRFVFNKITSLEISDTQTGLRAFNVDLMQKFVNIPGDRFEYETNMLLYCRNNNIPIKEVSIKTVYDKDDYKTHFNKIKDSISIYKNIFKSENRK